MRTYILKTNQKMPIMWELWVFQLLSSSSSPVALVSSHMKVLQFLPLLQNPPLSL